MPLLLSHLGDSNWLDHDVISWAAPQPPTRLGGAGSAWRACWPGAEVPALGCGAGPAVGSRARALSSATAFLGGASGPGRPSRPRSSFVSLHHYCCKKHDGYLVSEKMADECHEATAFAKCTNSECSCINPVNEKFEARKAIKQLFNEAYADRGVTWADVEGLLKESDISVDGHFQHSPPLGYKCCCGRSWREGKHDPASADCEKVTFTCSSKSKEYEVKDKPSDVPLPPGKWEAEGAAYVHDLKDGTYCMEGTFKDASGRAHRRIYTVNPKEEYQNDPELGGLVQMVDGEAHPVHEGCGDDEATAHVEEEWAEEHGHGHGEHQDEHLVEEDVFLEDHHDHH